MKKNYSTATLLLILLTSVTTFAQRKDIDRQLTQTIRGVVTDAASDAPISYATILLLSSPGHHTVTDANGNFTVKNVPIGRHTVQATFVGYESATLQEVLVTSAKEVYLEISLKEKVDNLEEAVVRPKVNKEAPLNSMATAGARMLSMEEASRYAGGMDDPARLVSSFAGAASGVGNNGISIHGNAPHLLQWKLEDVEIPNPNHFADLSTLGGGVLSSLSNHVLGNSDFLTGAMPAEYGNAISGVFDMKMKNGNNRTIENTFQLALLGIDLASEGPFSKNGNSSYIFNYRYSTLGLLSKLDSDSDIGGVMEYQDLNFKINLPTKKAGTFTVWGTSLIDKFSDIRDEDTNEWEHTQDNFTYVGDQLMAAAGFTHKYFFGTKSYLKTTLATTFAEHTAYQDSYDMSLTPSPYLDLYRRNTNLVLTSSYNHKFGAKHTNKTGFTYTRMIYDMNMDMAPLETMPLENISNGKGQTDLLNVYTSSAISLNDRLTMNVGVNSQLLSLNNSWTIEPRAGIKWQAGKRSSLAFAYGLNSRMEKMDVYFVRTPDSSSQTSNKELDFTKAHHLVLSYGLKLSENLNLRIEPYYQQLYDIPVEEGTAFSTINRTDFYVEKALVNKGKGRNYGVDVTLEKYLTNGLYYMVTASIFSSTYKGGDGSWHNTRYNRGYIVNGLIGKEWRLDAGGRNVLSTNVKLTYQGGQRYSPVDETATMANPDKEVQYDETRAFSKQYSPMLIANFTASYKINRKKVAHEFGVALLNFTRTPEPHGYHYNLKKGIIERNETATPIYNISYKIHF